MINAISKRACTFRPLSLLLLVMIVGLSLSLQGQTPTVTANFTYPEFKITTTPEFPSMCSQGNVKVKCNETYKKYTWKHKNGTTLSGQEVNITTGGAIHNGLNCAVTSMAMFHTMKVQKVFLILFHLIMLML